jgi:hypothetical protein
MERLLAMTPRKGAIPVCCMRRRRRRRIKPQGAAVLFSSDFCSL